ncbi:MAG: hypothetical protein M3082_10270, partial [Candidatus Dormibacteraeota bacterium]|nr:hypothetical protein [Candidatus Dormibacteraeota bacterium]
DRVLLQPDPTALVHRDAQPRRLREHHRCMITTRTRPENRGKLRGLTNATESIVAYLRSKFRYIEVVVPVFAMSAGTMISLASQRVVMGRQSQLGPIDPQMAFGGRFVSARAIVDQFERAKADVLGDQTLAHLWAPILQSLGPALLQEAQNALQYGEKMVSQWLAEQMFRRRANRNELGATVAKHFNDAGVHLSHGRRIDRTEARGQKLVIEDLERDQALQEAVLSAYHLATIAFEQSPTSKMIWTNTNRTWVKSWVPGP